MVLISAEEIYTFPKSCQQINYNVWQLKLWLRISYDAVTLSEQVRGQYMLTYT